MTTRQSPSPRAEVGRLRLGRGQRYESDWPQTISAILTFLPFGWSFLETVYKKRNGDSRTQRWRANTNTCSVGGRWRWRHQVVPQSGWDFDDNGGIQAMVQRPAWARARPDDPDREGAAIPDERRAVPIRKVAASFETRTDRTIFKKRIEEIEAIGIERDLAGFRSRASRPSTSTTKRATREGRIEEIKRIVPRRQGRTSRRVLTFPRRARPRPNEDLWEFKLLSTAGAGRSRRTDHRALRPAHGDDGPR